MPSLLTDKTTDLRDALDALENHIKNNLVPVDISEKDATKIYYLAETICRRAKDCILVHWESIMGREDPAGFASRIPFSPPLRRDEE